MTVDFDEVAVSIVVCERVPMRLTGADRVEAVRRLSAEGVTNRETLRLLRWNTDSFRPLERLRASHHIPPPVIEYDGLSRRALGLEHRDRKRGRK